MSSVQTPTKPQHRPRPKHEQYAEGLPKGLEQIDSLTTLYTMPRVREHENYGIVSDHWILNFLKACVAATVSVWLSIPGAVQLLVILSAFDLASTLFTHRSALWTTLRRVSVTLLLCGAVHVVYAMAKDLSGFNVGFDIGTAVVLFYVVGEIIEITLNCSMVIRIPPKFIEWLETAQGMTGAQKKQVQGMKEPKTRLYDEL